jgi:hypothetical protein
MEQALDPGVAILDQVAALEAERARIEARISARLLAFEDLRRRESEWTEDLTLRRTEMAFAAEELGSVLRQPGQAVQVPVG